MLSKISFALAMLAVSTDSIKLESNIFMHQADDAGAASATAANDSLTGASEAGEDANTAAADAIADSGEENEGAAASETEGQGETDADAPSTTDEKANTKLSDKPAGASAIMTSFGAMAILLISSTF